jgi:hypothetical protein
VALRSLGAETEQQQVDFGYQSNGRALVASPCIRLSLPNRLISGRLINEGKAESLLRQNPTNGPVPSMEGWLSIPT